MKLFKTTLMALTVLAATARRLRPGCNWPDTTWPPWVPICLKICKTAEGKAGEMTMDMSHDMDQAHADLMAGMDVTNKQMMDGMMVEDIDVAFVCGKIPHHQGAINMAKAELEHGDNQWAKDMAQKVIDAQEKEIAEMVTWLEGDGANE